MPPGSQAVDAQGVFEEKIEVAAAFQRIIQRPLSGVRLSRISYYLAMTTEAWRRMARVYSKMRIVVT